MELLINGTSHEIDDPRELHVELERIRQLPFADAWLQPVASWPAICALINAEAAWLSICALRAMPDLLRAIPTIQDHRVLPSNITCRMDSAMNIPPPGTSRQMRHCVRSRTFSREQKRRRGRSGMKIANQNRRVIRF
jgi:hypothetical protein